MPNAVTILTARAGIARGCGVARTQGAVYLECGVGSTGVPLEHYLVDPPQPYDTDQKIGVSIVPDGKGTYHVIDWVGAEHYPMPNDFLEEGRLHGFSRKISRTTEFDKLTKDSRLIFVHPKAIVANAAEIAPFLPDHKLKSRCAHFAKTGEDDHFQTPNASCTRLWYALAEANSTRITSDDMLLPERKVSADTSYVVEPLPYGAPEPVYRPGIIAKVPITNLSVIATKDGGHKATLSRVAQAVQGIPVIERPN